jgi:hypothetical protein
VLVLRADPWQPAYGMGFEGTEPETDALVDPTVETDNWSLPRVPAVDPPRTTWFIDGVRRLELRLLATANGRQRPAAFGSYAAGSVRCADRAEFGEHCVERRLIVGGGLPLEDVTVACGGAQLTFAGLGELSAEPDQLLWKLQDEMRLAEATLADTLPVDDDSVVLLDGPLTFPGTPRRAVVGVAKRSVRMYLEQPYEDLIPALEPGQRTPLFGLGQPTSGVQRFAWYTRVMALRPPWHDHAAIVRGEVRAVHGLDGARLLADRVTVALPGYAGRLGDPRTPQNLAPVAGLEAWLRHRLGDPRLIRRALLEHLCT